MGFYGTSEHTLDAKHRVVVPKRWQEELRVGESFPVVLTRGFEGCLFLFSVAGFEAAEERMARQPFAGEKTRRMQRLFFSNVHKGELDPRSGRLLVPEPLRASAGLEREVVLVGVSERAEIWSKDRWTRFRADHDEEFDELDRVIMGEGEGGG